MSAVVTAPGRALWEIVFEGDRSGPTYYIRAAWWILCTWLRKHACLRYKVMFSSFLEGKCASALEQLFHFWLADATRTQHSKPAQKQLTDTKQLICGLTYH
jgi:hypothetical protein